MHSRSRSRTTRRRPFPGTGKIVDIDSLVATTATLGDHDQYVAAYANLSRLAGRCLILGIAIPARDELERAKAVRDRFAAEVLPKLPGHEPHRAEGDVLGRGHGARCSSSISRRGCHR